MKIKAKAFRDGLVFNPDDELDVVLTVDAFRSNDQGATSNNKDPASTLEMQLGEDTLRPKNVKVTSLPALPANQSVNVNQWGGAGTTLGQKAMSASVPVAIASDQAAIPVTPGKPTQHNVLGTGVSTAATGVAITFTAGASGSAIFFYSAAGVGSAAAPTSMGAAVQCQFQIQQSGATYICLFQTAGGAAGTLSLTEEQGANAGSAVARITIVAATVASTADFTIFGKDY